MAASPPPYAAYATPTPEVGRFEQSIHMREAGALCCFPISVGLFSSVSGCSFDLNLKSVSVKLEIHSKASLFIIVFLFA